MGNLRETAMAYESEARIKNIVELPRISIDDVNIEHKEVKDATGKLIFACEIIRINNEEYRVPKTVLKSLKVMLEDNPTMKAFKVKRTGTTKEDTIYTVIPLL